MNAGETSTVSTTSRYTHRALLYATTDELLTALVEFVKEGIEADEHVLVVVDSDKGEMLVDRLGTADGFQLANAADIYTSPTKTLAAYIDTVRDATSDGRPMRVAGEPIWTGLSALEVAEWTCVESACNVAFAESALTMLCPYDVSVLDPSIVDAARRTHPRVQSGDDTTVSETFTDPHRFHSAVRQTNLTAPTGQFHECSIVSANELGRAQDVIESFGDQHALPVGRISDLVAAVTDVARTALAGGARPLSLRLWLHEGQVVCDVSGAWTTVPFAGFIQHPSERPGSPSLWSPGQLCDLIAVREHGALTTVRLQVSGLPMEVNPTCAEFAEFLGVYALGACEPDENVMIESHLAECITCRQEAIKLGAVVDRMITELEATDSPPRGQDPSDDPPDM